MRKWNGDLARIAIITREHKARLTILFDVKSETVFNLRITEGKGGCKGFRAHSLRIKLYNRMVVASWLRILHQMNHCIQLAIVFNDARGATESAENGGCGIGGMNVHRVILLH